MRRSTVSLALTLGLACLAPPSLQARELTIEERIAAERAIERVYWSHRDWPSHNSGPKPAFDAVFPEAALRDRVEDYLRKSNALEAHWGRTITAQQLQAEIERMARSTRAPDTLREIFAALGDDPYVIAETLARQRLADRLIHNYYAKDERFHGEVRERAESMLGKVAGVEQLSETGAAYREELWRLEGTDADAETPRPGEVMLDNTTWTDRVDRLEEDLGGDLVPGNVGRLRESKTEFSASAILDKGEGWIRVATASWPKRTFEEWWGETRPTTDRHVEEQRATYSPVVIPAGRDGCTVDSWRGLPSTGPSTRKNHIAVWTGAEMIIWGGAVTFGDDFVNTGGRYDPATDTWLGMSTAAAPSGRYDPTAVWTGTEMIVWGGYGAGYELLNSGGRYDPVSDTWTATSTVGAPSNRERYTAVWTGTELIVWGGVDDNPLGTGGRYDPAEDRWLDVSTIGAPTARESPTSVWTGTEMIVWGGRDESGHMNSGGHYNPAQNTWTPTATTGAPLPRGGHTAVWTGDEMIVWGGRISAETNTGGRYDPALQQWEATSTIGTPGGRMRHTAVWTGNVMVVWGGSSFGAGGAHGGRYDPEDDSWLLTETVGAPIPRSSHTAIWTGTEMIVWGGEDYYHIQGTGYRYDPVGDSWLPVGGPNLPTPRYGHTSVWTGAEIIVWGGYPDWDGGRYDPATNDWLPISQTGVPPFRYDHSAVWTGTEMIMWGGGGFATGGRYNPATDSWQPMPTDSAPTTVYRDPVFWTGTEMIVWRGPGATARFDPVANVWTPISDGGPSEYRYGPSWVWTGTELLLWGGRNYNSTIYYQSGYRYDPATDSWSPMSTAGAPSERSYPSTVWTGIEMIVWGGSVPGIFYRGARYDPNTDTWSPVSPVNDPSPRYPFDAVWTGVEMIVWGGEEDDDDTGLGDGARYDPLSNSWMPLPSEMAPYPRSRHTMVWTGEEAIVWGGRAPGWLGDGAGYCAPLSDDTDGDGWFVGFDCDDLNPDTYPGAAEVCDGASNDCLDPDYPDPPPGEVDIDTDGSPNCADCAPNDGQLWASPEAVTGLVLTHAGGDDGTTTVSWTAPGDPGSTTVLYDTVVSSSANEFETAAWCIETDDPDTVAHDLTTPPPGAAHYFLVRATNACGSGAVATGSDGAERSLAVCPPDVIVNGGMEDWSGPTNLAAWNEATNGGTVDQETDPAHVFNGSHAARLTRTGVTVLNINQDLTLSEPGTTYRLRVAAKFGEVRDRAMQVRIHNTTRDEELKADGTWSAGTYWFPIDLTTEYALQGFDFTVDPGFDAADDYLFVIRHNDANPAGSELWVDAASIRP